MRYLIDSDWLADYLKGRAAAQTLLESLFPDGLAISIITYAEVYEGIYWGRDRQLHEVGFRSFIQAAPVLSLTRAIARRYAAVAGRCCFPGKCLGYRHHPRRSGLACACALRSPGTQRKVGLRDRLGRVQPRAARPSRQLRPGQYPSARVHRHRWVRLRPHGAKLRSASRPGHGPCSVPRHLHGSRYHHASAACHRAGDAFLKWGWSAVALP